MNAHRRRAARPRLMASPRAECLPAAEATQRHVAQSFADAARFLRRHAARSAQFSPSARSVAAFTPAAPDARPERAGMQYGARHAASVIFAVRCRADAAAHFHRLRLRRMPPMMYARQRRCRSGAAARRRRHAACSFRAVFPRFDCLLRRLRARIAAVAAAYVRASAIEENFFQIFFSAPHTLFH